MNILYRNGLPWPPNKQRRTDRKPSQFRTASRGIAKEPPTSDAAKRIQDQVSAFTRAGQTWRTTELVIWSYAATGKKVGIVSDKPSNPDPGVVVTFDLDKRVYTIACDRYTTIAGNLCAIAAYVEGLRAQERHGVADLQEMLAGHLALPAAKQWHEVLGVSPTATRDQIKVAYRQLAAIHHPDQGGDANKMAEINAAYEEGMKS